MLARVAADELGRYWATVDAIAPVARTRLTGWLPGGPADGDYPWAAEQVAPVVARLLGPEARDITGRVVEVGNRQLSVPGGRQPGPPRTLRPGMTPAEVGAALSRAFEAARTPPELFGTDPG